MKAPQDLTSVKSVPWDQLVSDERTVLCFIIFHGKVLLIRKKTGLGAGMLNVPGGRQISGETPLQGAVRETQEETGLTPTNLIQAGRLFFYFTSGYFQSCEVFRAGGYWGEPVSTPEADPFWVKLEQVPYEKMWEGDRFWIPGLLRGETFFGKLVFSGESLLDASIART